MRLRSIRSASLAAVLPLLACGCTVGFGDGAAPSTDQGPNGVYVTVGTLEGLLPGTARREVLTLLGEPTAIDALDDTADGELWTWCCETVDAPRSNVLLLTRRTPGPTSTRARIAFEHGRVVRAWLELPPARPVEAAPTAKAPAATTATEAID